MALRMLLLLVLTSLVAAGCGAAELTIVDHGVTAYCIYVDAAAPASVEAAAADLQTYVERIFGAKLPIVAQPREPMIGLGASAAAAALGVNTAGVPLEGYRIAARRGNLFILGPDTSDGQTTPQGGVSNGTANGVYTFIEQVMGVRWLMPGEHGESVPPPVPTRTFALTVNENLDTTEAPYFANRRVPYIQENRPETKQWWARQRLGYSLALYHSHNWQHFTLDDFRAHPEWFAEHGGERMAPVSDRFKLCTTNDGLVREFADRALRYFAEHPQATCYSLSPTDSAGWCECQKCRALYEQDPNGELSVTPAVIDFYNRVARLVAKREPDKLLAGYIYAQYVFPPSKPFALAPNVFLVWAPSFDYGFTLFRPDMQQQWAALVPQWLKVTDRIAYYDLPNCIHNELGAINPPALKILKWLYPRLKQAKMKGVYVYGNPAWGYAGPMNYLLAKLAWNPDADVDALLDDYLKRCYAEGAPELKQFYALLDDETEKYFNADHNESWTLREGRLRAVYGANFPALERLYREAERKITDPEAKARLAMLGANLTILHWNLRQMKAIAEPEASSFYLPDREFFALVKAWGGSLAVAPTVGAARDKLAGQKLTLRPLTPSSTQPVAPSLLRGNQRLVLKPTGAGGARVNFASITSRGGLVKYQLYDSAGAQVDTGVVTAETPVVLPAGSEYYLLTVAAGSASFAVKVEGAAWALSSGVDEKGLHFLGKVTPLYFEVPQGVASFDFWLSSDAPGETAAGKLLAPDGTPVARFRTVEKTIDTQVVKVGAGQAGVWVFVPETPEKGVVDDVYVKLGAQLSGHVSLDPAAALAVAAAK